MLFWGVLDPFLDLKGIKIFFFTNIYVYNYFLGQTKPFATSNRDRLDTPKINLNVHWSLLCHLCPQARVDHFTHFTPVFHFTSQTLLDNDCLVCQAPVP